MSAGSDIAGNVIATQRLRNLRRRAGMTQEEVAHILGLSGQSSYRHYENPKKFKDEFFSLEIVSKLAKEFVGKGQPPIAEDEVLALASPYTREILASSAALWAERADKIYSRRAPQLQSVVAESQHSDPGSIPIYGQAIGGAHGSFPWNGEEMDRVPVPPPLIGIHDAYGVQVAGDSMEPRYYAGEYVYVHPYKAVARGAFVVIQVEEPGNAVPLAYVKRFEKADDEIITVSQLNPPETLTFPRARVLSIHRIVMGGES